MSEYFQVHPETPQARLIEAAAAVVRRGGILAYPTDSCYALGAAVGNKTGMERIRRIRAMDAKHYFTLICRDLSELRTYAMFDTPVYRLLKANTPGPYAFVLPATREAPRRLRDARRKTIGLRVPDHRIAQALLEELNAPMMTSSLILPGEDLPIVDPREIEERLGHELDGIVDGGLCYAQPTTIVDLTDEVPRILRVGQGDPSAFQ